MKKLLALSLAMICLTAMADVIQAPFTNNHMINVTGVGPACSAKIENPVQGLCLAQIGGCQLLHIEPADILTNQTYYTFCTPATQTTINNSPSDGANNLHGPFHLFYIDGNGQAKGCVIEGTASANISIYLLNEGETSAPAVDNCSYSTFNICARPFGGPEVCSCSAPFDPSSATPIPVMANHNQNFADCATVG